MPVASASAAAPARICFLIKTSSFGTVAGFNGPGGSPVAKEGESPSKIIVRFQPCTGLFCAGKAALQSREALPVPESRFPLRERLRFDLPFDRRQGIAMDHGLEAAQTLINRNQLNDRAPGVNEILERLADLCERILDLLEWAERELAGNDGWYQQNVRKNDVRLQIDDTADVEIHEVEIEPKIIVADIGEQYRQRWRVGLGRIVLAEDELLAVGGLDALVAEFDSGQTNTDQGESAGADD